LKDKTVELVVNPSLIDVISEDDDADDELKIGEGSGEENTAIEAKADGSFNELTDEDAKIVSPEAVTPEAVTPEVVTPEVKAPKVTPNKGK
jgi:hypothetical protein